MDVPNKFEIHYFLKNSSHLMDAVVRNKCEAEFLAIAYEVISELGFNITLDSEAFREGGLKNIWKFLGNNSAQLALIISTIALIISMVPATDSEYLELQKEDIKLSIEEKKLSIEKLEKELGKETISQQLVESTAQTMNSNYKVVTRRSNFYQHLSHYNNVTQIGVSTLSTDDRYLTKESIVPRDSFTKFILVTDKLKPVIDENAIIEIVAPVLRGAKTKWKGLYNDVPISFSMDDKDFKDAVLSKRIGFKSGSVIVCVLTVQQNINQIGEIVTSGYNVTTVLDKIDNGVVVETVKGKNYRYNKKLQDKQTELFFVDKQVQLLSIPR